MSRGNLFFGNASGKLGESVFYRSGGEQRNRTYVPHIKNPRTEAQVRNRIQLGNWAAMYRRLKPILEKTFTNRPVNESGFNALVKANKARLRYAVDKNMLEDCDYNAIGAKVSSGTIVCNIKPELVPMNDVQEKNTPPRYYTKLMDLQRIPLQIEEGRRANDGLRGKDLYQLMTANGNPMNLPSDFKVITLYGSYEIDDETGQYSEGGMPLSYRVYTCNAIDESEGLLVGNQKFDDATKVVPYGSEWTAATSGENFVGTLIVQGLAIGGFVAPSDMDYDCFGMIIYYENETGKNANNAFVYGYPKAVEIASDWAEGGEVFEEILQNVGFESSSVLSSSRRIVKPDFSDYVAPGMPVEEPSNPDDEDEGGMD